LATCTTIGEQEKRPITETASPDFSDGERLLPRRQAHTTIPWITYHARFDVAAEKIIATLKHGFIPFLLGRDHLPAVAGVIEVMSIGL